LSAAGPGTGGGAWYVGANIYAEFIKSIGLVNSDDMRVESEVKWSETVSRHKSTKTNPQIGLVRFQFLEIIMKLGFKRFLGIGECKTHAEAVKNMVRLIFKPIYDKQNASEEEEKFPTESLSVFREERYWKEEVDNLFKSHKEVFEKLFAAFSNRHKTPVDKVNFCKADEFEDFFNVNELV
jgi:hypothetical protein